MNAPIKDGGRVTSAMVDRFKTAFAEHSGISPEYDGCIRAALEAALAAQGQSPASPASAEPVQVERFNQRRFEEAPCYLCGYNGPGYFQPGTHRCAAKYHAPAAKPDEPAQPTHEPDCNLHMASVKRRMVGCDCIQSNPAPSAQPAANQLSQDAEIARKSQESTQQFIRGREWAERAGKQEARADRAEALLHEVLITAGQQLDMACVLDRIRRLLIEGVQEIAASPSAAREAQL